MNELMINEKDRLLVVAPHPDDESIGCGGLLAKYAAITDVLLVTDGSKGAYLGESTEEIILKRRNEFLEAMGIVNIANSYFLDIPDRDVFKHFKDIKKFNIAKYSKIFVPNRNEKHIDHNCLFGMFSKMISFNKLKIDLYEYEVWSPIASPNYFVNIEDVIDVKIKMVNSYKSQLCCYDYVGIANSLSLYRGAFAKIKYAEAYYLESKVSYFKKCIRKIKHLKNRLAKK